MKKKRGSEKSWGHPDQDTNTTLHHRGDDRLVFQTIISFLATRGNSGFFSPIVLVLIGQIVMIWFKYVVRVYSSSCSCSPVDVEKDKSQRLKTDLWHSVKTLWICWLQTFQQFNLQEEQGAEEGDGGRGRSQHLRGDGGGEGGEGDAGERERVYYWLPTLPCHWVNGVLPLPIAPVPSEPWPLHRERSLTLRSASSGASFPPRLQDGLSAGVWRLTSCLYAAAAAVTLCVVFHLWKQHKDSD